MNRTLVVYKEYGPWTGLNLGQAQRNRGRRARDLPQAKAAGSGTKGRHKVRGDPDEGSDWLILAFTDAL